MPGLSEDELAARSGVPASTIRWMAEAGAVRRRDGADAATAFDASDVNRVRLVQALLDSGIGRDDLASALGRGDLSLDFIADLFPEPVDHVPGMTYASAAASLGLTVEALQEVHTRLGLATPLPDAPVRTDEAEMMPLLGLALGSGFDQPGLARFARVLGDTLARLAQAQVRFTTEAVVRGMIEAGASRQDAWARGASLSPQMRPLYERLMTWVYWRHWETFVLEDVIQDIEDVLRPAADGRRGRPQAIAFLDLSGFTRLTEERGDEAAAQLASDLADLVQGAARQHGGRAVKLLGDGVMFHFPDPPGALRCSLELVERAPSEGLPPAHVGVHAGAVVYREGDYFGRTVNVAARVAAKAGPHQVLVTEDVLRTVPDGEAAYTSLGPVELKGVAAPVTLYHATRTGS